MRNFNAAEIQVLRQALDEACAERGRLFGEVTAIERNLIAARLIEAASNANTEVSALANVVRLANVA